MKKVLVIVLAVMLGVALLAVVGCGGGDTETAKEYMKTADSANDAMLKMADELDKKTEIIIGAAVTGDVSSIKDYDLSAIEGEMGLLLEEVARVRKLYEKIPLLEGVGDYEVYANAMIRFLDAEKAILDAGNQLYQQLAPAISQLMSTGDATALTAAMQQAGTELEAIDSLQDSADAALKSAQKIKTDKNI